MNPILLPCCFRLVALVLIFAVTTLSGCMRRHTSVEEIDKMIKEQVPIGSDKQQVKSFLDNFKVGSLEIGRDKEFHQADRRSLGTAYTGKVAELGNTIAESIGAYISKPESDGIITFNGIAICFYIGRDGRLIHYTVELRGEI